MTEAERFLKEIPDKCRTIILADTGLTEVAAKTAHGLLRYPFFLEPVAVVDRSGLSSVREALPWYEGPAVPIVPSIREAMREQPDLAVVGVAPPGGSLSEDLRIDVLGALESGLHVVSGLHQFLGEDEIMKQASIERGGKIYDLRRPPENFHIYRSQSSPSKTPVILVCGTDCAVGKRTTAVQLWIAAKEAGIRAAFLATGQTGVMLGPDAGLVVDRIPGDFISGEVQAKIQDLEAQDFDVIIVEGQGALHHPAYGAVTLGLLLGSAPDGIIMVHDPVRQKYHDTDIEIPGLDLEIESVQKLGKVRTLAFSTRGLNSCKSLENKGFTPALDPLMPGHADALWKIIANALSIDIRI